MHIQFNIPRSYGEDHMTNQNTYFQKKRKKLKDLGHLNMLFINNNSPASSLHFLMTVQKGIFLRNDMTLCRSTVFRRRS